MLRSKTLSQLTIIFTTDLRKYLILRSRNTKEITSKT